MLALQKTKRTGWIRKDVVEPESIADHMYRMGMMALIGGSSGIDTNRQVGRSVQFSPENRLAPWTKQVDKRLHAGASSLLSLMMLRKVRRRKLCVI